MSTQNDWGRWQQQWQQQPSTPDIDRLQRQVRRKRWRMVAAVVLQGLAVAFAVVQLIYFQLLPQLPLRWQVAGFAMLGFLVVALWFAMYIRRGTWGLATADSRDLLELSARRARAGIRLAWLEIYSMLAMLAIVLVAAWPWLQPDRWQHDAHLRLLLAIQFGVNTPIVVGGLVLSLWYIRRQRRRLHQLEAWLQE